jgi:hypothetical protein
MTSEHIVAVVRTRQFPAPSQNPSLPQGSAFGQRDLGSAMPPTIAEHVPSA